MRGGLRSRLILDSARVTIIAALEDLGWFDPTTYDDPPGLRRHRRLQYLAKPAHWDEEVEVNAFTINAENIDDEDIGLGGEVEDTLRCYIDVFAQDTQFGMHFSSDLRDILVGKMPSIGRNGAYIDVYDLRGATPMAFTTVEVDAVRIDRAENTVRAWQEFWFMVRFDLIDDYADEFGSVPIAEWSDDLLPAWQRIQALQ